MSKKTRWQRFLIGFACTLAVLIAGFAIFLTLIPTWGATPEEAARTLPGDELVTGDPSVRWTVAKNVNAPAEDVYPWLVQIGDTRAGYYSYMFIEKLFDAKLYNNADRIHPEWQTPEKGQGVIFNILAVEDYEPGSWFLVRDTPELGGVKWVWVWLVEPVDATHSRLINRFIIQAPGETGQSPLLAYLVSGGFIMEQNMMQGIVQRAEGRGEFAYIEPVEILLWLAALFAGLWAARSFLVRPDWQLPLAVGLCAVAWLFILTFIQPAIWVRLLGDLILLDGAAHAAGMIPTGRRAPVSKTAVSVG
jgi:hypothetical protein